MLKRISTIQNIGRFKSCSAGAAQFEKITLIFGQNTYGKSTLADLLSSLETGIVDALTTQRTFPDDILHAIYHREEQVIELHGRRANWVCDYPYISIARKHARIIIEGR